MRRLVIRHLVIQACLSLMGTGRAIRLPISLLGMRDNQKSASYFKEKLHLGLAFRNDITTVLFVTYIRLKNDGDQYV